MNEYKNATKKVNTMSRAEDNYIETNTAMICLFKKSTKASGLPHFTPLKLGSHRHVALFRNGFYPYIPSPV